MQSSIKGAVAALDELCALTQEDIDLLAQANHSKLQENAAKKTKLIGRFEESKASLDNALQDLAKRGDIEDFLDDEDKEHLSMLKSSLQRLQELNKEYARSLRAVKSFYDNLISTLIEPQGFSNDYGASYEREGFFAKKF